MTLLSTLHRARGGRRAFTLIELLVVIAIIAMLIGILLPALGKARDAARGVECISRARDLAAASAYYSQANKEAFARSQHSAAANRVGAWEQLHYSYFTDAEYNYDSGAPWWDDESWWSTVREHYQCPFDRRDNPAYRDGLPFPVPAISYGQNVYFELRAEEIDPDRWQGRQYAPYRRLSAIHDPSATVLFAELKDSSLTDHIMAHFWVLNSATPEQDVTRHGSGTGVVYVDGHAAEAGMLDNFDPERGVDRWNPATAH